MSTVQEATFNYHPYELYRLETGPETSTLLTREKVLKYYHQMVSIRRIETAAANLYNEKEIRGFCHGLCYHLLPCSRVHPCDGSPCVGCAREAGWKEERGDQVHMYTKNFYCRNGIVGDQVPLVAGIAFVHKYKGNGGVDFSLYGDGAANQGQVFEAFNLAKLWNLPVVFICENNHYGMGTSQKRHAASTDFYKRGDYIPGIHVDGFDILAAREATRFAAEYCQENGPLV